MSIRKPLELKLLESTYRADKDGDATLLSQITEPLTSVEPPTSLKTKKMKQAWLTTLEPLCRMKLISQQDLIMLEVAFNSLDVFYKVNAQLAKEWKRDIPNYKTIDKLNSIMNRNAETYFKIMSKFGVSPVERSKLIASASLTLRKKKSLAEEMMDDCDA